MDDIKGLSAEAWRDPIFILKAHSVGGHVEVGLEVRGVLEAGECGSTGQRQDMKVGIEKE